MSVQVAVSTKDEKKTDNYYDDSSVLPSVQRDFLQDLKLPLPSAKKIDSAHKKLESLDQKAYSALHEIEDEEIRNVCISELLRISAQLKDLSYSPRLIVSDEKKAQEEKSLLEYIADKYVSSVNAVTLFGKSNLKSNLKSLLEIDSNHWISIAEARTGDRPYYDDNISSLTLMIHGSAVLNPQYKDLFQTKDGVERVRILANILKAFDLTFNEVNLSAFHKLSLLCEGNDDLLESKFREIASKVHKWNKDCPSTGSYLLQYFSATGFDDLNQWDKALKNLDLYLKGLLVNGEPDIREGVQSFAKVAEHIFPSEELIKNLLILHRSSGTLHFSRLVSPEDLNQENMEQVVDKLVKSFLNPTDHNTKVAVVIFTGLGDIFGDAFSLDGGRVLKQLFDKGYKVFPYEVHSAQEVADVAKKTSILTKKGNNIIIPAGHGSVGTFVLDNKEIRSEDGMALVLGDSDVRIDHQGASKKVINNAKSALTEDEKKWFSFLDQRTNTEPWKVQSLSNSKLTRDSANLDKNDSSEFQEIAQTLSEKGSVVFFSCGSGLDSAKPSLAESFAKNTQVKTFAAKSAFTHMELVFDNEGNVVDVKYSDHFIIHITEEMLKKDPKFKNGIKEVETFRYVPTN